MDRVLESQTHEILYKGADKIYLQAIKVAPVAKEADNILDAYVIPTLATGQLRLEVIRRCFGSKERREVAWKGRLNPV